jgi:hypothetical protein
MQISRDDDEQLINLKASSETLKKKVNQQTEHFNDLNRVHLRNEHRRSSSNLFDHCIVSIHLLCLDLIRSQWETRFQAERECDVVLHERHSNSNDLDHFKYLQKHRWCDFKRWVISVFHSSTVRHDHLWRASSSNHQLDILLHKKSQSTIQSISRFRSQSNAASANALRSAKLSTEAEN